MSYEGHSILCQSLEDTQPLLKRLADPATKTLVYDSETTGLTQSDHIVGHVLTFGPAPQDTAYVPVRHHPEHRGNIHPHRDLLGHPFEVEFGAILAARRDLHVIGHNLMFDLSKMHRHKIEPVGTVEDTQVNAALIDEFAISYSLGNCCLRMEVQEKKGTQLYEHLASLFGGSPTDRSLMAHFWKLSGDDAIGVDYATGDGISTWQLREAQLRAMVKQELTDIHLLECGVTRVLYRMKKRGVRIDQGYLQEVADFAEEQVREGLKALPPDFNVRGPKQIRELLESVEYTDWPMTAPSKKFPNGQPSFPESFLKGHPIGQAIVNVRKWSNLANSFVRPLMERHVTGGRVHPDYWQMANDDFGTITGRLSCSGPNLQQVPKRNKEIAKRFRPIFIPDEGLDWWDADLSQCEPRLLAHYSGAKVLLNGYLANPPVDAHQAVTDAIIHIGVPIDREDGKRVNQTLITGGGKGKIIAMLGERGEEIYDGYFRAMPEVKKLQQESKARFRNRGWVKSLLGRRARLEHPSKDYLAMNRLLQCGNADVIKRAMVDIDNHFEANGDTCNLLNNVHDALSMQGPPNEREQMLEALRLFTNFGPGRAVPLRVPMACDYGIGRNWGEATFPTEKLTLGQAVTEGAVYAPPSRAIPQTIAQTPEEKRLTAELNQLKSDMAWDSHNRYQEKEAERLRNGGYQGGL